MNATNGIHALLPDLTRHGGRVSHVAAGDRLMTSSARSDAVLLTAHDRATISAITGVPFTPDGQPDFERARAGGQSVTGAIPGGYETVTFNDGENQVTFFVAQISSDRKSGALTGELTPQYFRGMLLTVSDESTDVRRREFIENALRYFDQLPRTAAEAERRANEPTFEVTV